MNFKLIATVIIVFCVFGLQAQQKETENALMKKELIILDRVPLDSTHFIGLGKSSLRYNFFLDSKDFNEIQTKDILWAGLLNKDVIKSTFYSPYDNESQASIISQAQVNRQLGNVIDTTLDIDPDTGEQIIIIDITKSTKDQLTGMMFYDEWNFDAENFKLYKEVKAYIPVRQYYRVDDIDKKSARYSVTGWFTFDNDKKNNKSSDKRMKLFKKIKYEFYLENLSYSDYDCYNELCPSIEKPNSPFWTSYGRMEFRNLIIAKAGITDYALDLNQKRTYENLSPVYDFETGDKLSLNEINERAGCSIDTIYDIDPDTGNQITIIDKTNVNPGEIKSVIFLEHWYIDKQTLRIKKKVIGVAPIRTYYREDDIDEENPIKKILYVLYFDEKEKF